MGRLKKDFLSIEEDFLNIEEEFCKLDHENKVAGIPLHFEKPGDIFADCAGTTTPLVSADFIECLYRCFDYIMDCYDTAIYLVVNARLAILETLDAAYEYETRFGEQLEVVEGEQPEA